METDFFLLCGGGCFLLSDGTSSFALACARYAGYHGSRDGGDATARIFIMHWNILIGVLDGVYYNCIILVSGTARGHTRQNVFPGL